MTHPIFAQACGSVPPSPELLEVLAGLPPDPEILLLGDLHGKWPAATAAYREACRARGRKPDLLIQLGDWGYYRQLAAGPLWRQTPMPFSDAPEPVWEHPVVFIDGNHDDHRALAEDAFARRDWPANVFYAPRGLIWSGVLFMGGAYSVNKKQLLATRGGSDWWSPLEEVSPAQVDRVLSLAATARNVKGGVRPDPAGEYALWQEVHTVFSHTAPSSFNLAPYAKECWGGENKQEQSRVELERLWRAFRPASWAFGHWHVDTRGYAAPTRWRLLDEIPSGAYPDYAWVKLSDLREGKAFLSL